MLKQKDDVCLFVNIYITKDIIIICYKKKEYGLSFPLFRVLRFREIFGGVKDFPLFFGSLVFFHSDFLLEFIKGAFPFFFPRPYFSILNTFYGGKNFPFFPCQIWAPKGFPL